MSAIWPLNAANSITLGRLLLIAAFAVAAWLDNLTAATFFFIIAWLLDAFDGWLARRLHQETTAGYLFDKVVDRLLIVGGVVLLIALHHLPVWALWLLVKDIVAVPTLMLQARSHTLAIGLGWPGKLVTLLQGLAIIWLLLAIPRGEIVVAATAVLGGLVAVRHEYRVLKEIMPKLSTSG